MIQLSECRKNLTSDLWWTSLKQIKIIVECSGFNIIYSQMLVWIKFNQDSADLILIDNHVNVLCHRPTVDLIGAMETQSEPSELELDDVVITNPHIEAILENEDWIEDASYVFCFFVFVESLCFIIGRSCQLILWTFLQQWSGLSLHLHPEGNRHTYLILLNQSVISMHSKHGCPVPIDSSKRSVCQSINCLGP